MRQLLPLLFALCLVGCAAKKKPAAVPDLHFSVIVPRYCIKALELTQDTYCRGDEVHKLVCYKMNLRYVQGCEQVHAERQ